MTFGYFFANNKVPFNLLKQVLVKCFYLMTVRVLKTHDLTTLTQYILVKVVCLKLLKQVLCSDHGVDG